MDFRRLQKGPLIISTWQTCVVFFESMVVNKTAKVSMPFPEYNYYFSLFQLMMNTQVCLTHAFKLSILVSEWFEQFTLLHVGQRLL